MDTYTIYLAAFVLGIGSSLHCLGMCGPLVMAVPIASSKYKSLSMFAYLFSKAVAYASMGLVFGALGLGLFLMEWQQTISILAGIIIILIAIFPLLKIKSLGNRFQIIITQFFSKFLHHQKWYSIIILGFLNGLLPCGMVYVALTTAVASGSPLNGAIAMLCFGIGTMPILFITMYMKSKLSFRLRSRLQPVTLGLSILVGILMILRGAGLGIPYLSPAVEIHASKVEGSCH